MIRAAKQCTSKIYSGFMAGVKPLGSLTRATTITYEESPSRELAVWFDDLTTNGFPCPFAQSWSKGRHDDSSSSTVTAKRENL